MTPQHTARLGSLHRALNEVLTQLDLVPRSATRYSRSRERRPYLWFFFSSRRRHTRCSRDWSSDVCSSDLNGELLQVSLLLRLGPRANLTNRPQSPGASMECLANAESVFLVKLQDCDAFMLEQAI